MLFAGGAFSGSDGGGTSEASPDPPPVTTEAQPAPEPEPEPDPEAPPRTVTVTDSVPPETPAGEVFRTAGFQSPTGNLRCNTGGGLLTCSRGNDGLSAYMDATSQPDTIFDDLQTGGVVVSYGSDWESGTFRCDSESTGITCRSTTSGHGFFLSRDVYEPFSG